MYIVATPPNCGKPLKLTLLPYDGNICNGTPGKLGKMTNVRAK
jgi:hypothetical protein